MTTTTIMSYSISVNSPSLGTAPEAAKSKPHHVKNKYGTTTKFQNPHPSYKAAFQPWEFPVRSLMGQFDGSMRMPAPKGETVPIRTPEFLTSRQGSKYLRTTWLGHACHYVEFPSGLRVLFDPVMEDRCSPFTFAGPQRYTRRACGIADLPFLDAVLISHSHYDHLSLSTVHEVRSRFPDAHFFVGLGLASWFRDSGIEDVTEMDWWEDAEVTVKPDNKDTGAGAGGDGGGGGEDITATVSCLPAQHGSARSPFDHEKTLWCSWAVKSAAKSVYFAGDTGYRSVPATVKDEEATHDYGDQLADLPTNPDFKEIGSLRGPFDVGLIPIGAYRPRLLFSPLHASPSDAVEIFRHTECRAALAIHWGTWALTSEPVMEPPERLREALRRRGLPEEGVFDICDIGETRVF
ncbi:NAPE-hydrolyzing phospholipase D [Diaporthe helianthi]|uniref:NAPE-hydrolyzing phospholipase D n=1 Tax=Diaporthe helianthi TaxID=158607 RepID=A0A2P5IAV0_DIAHE|nr:NAPE-hydrolyzing phospholipase D [Diaporthe helianthi]